MLDQLMKGAAQMSFNLPGESEALFPGLWFGRFYREFYEIPNSLTHFLAYYLFPVVAFFWCLSRVVSLRWSFTSKAWGMLLISLGIFSTYLDYLQLKKSAQVFALGTPPQFTFSLADLSLGLGIIIYFLTRIKILRPGPGYEAPSV